MQKLFSVLVAFILVSCSPSAIKIPTEADSQVAGAILEDSENTSESDASGKTQLTCDAAVGDDKLPEVLVFMRPDLSASTCAPRAPSSEDDQIIVYKGDYKPDLNNSWFKTVSENVTESSGSGCRRFHVLANQQLNFARMGGSLWVLAERGSRVTVGQAGGGQQIFLKAGATLDVNSLSRSEIICEPGAIINNLNAASGNKVKKVRLITYKFN